MKSYGKCELCGAKKVMRQYKMKDGKNSFKTFYPCSKTVKHSYSEDAFKDIDVSWHASQTGKMVSVNA